MISLADDGGPIDSAGGGGFQPLGDSYQSWTSGPHVAAGQVAHFKATVRFDDLPSGNPMTPPPRLSLAFSVRVQSVTHLANPAAFVMGGHRVTIQHLDMTPGFINVVALFAGASGDDFNPGPGQPELVTALDASGARVRTVAGGGGIAAGGWAASYQFARFSQPSPYSLQFVFHNDKHTVPVK